jgi:hypothetical protein
VKEQTDDLPPASRECGKSIKFVGDKDILMSKQLEMNFTSSPLCGSSVPCGKDVKNCPHFNKFDHPEMLFKCYEFRWCPILEALSIKPYRTCYREGDSNCAWASALGRCESICGSKYYDGIADFEKMAKTRDCAKEILLEDEKALEGEMAKFIGTLKTFALVDFVDHKITAVIDGISREYFRHNASHVLDKENEERPIITSKMYNFYFSEHLDISYSQSFNIRQICNLKMAPVKGNEYVDRPNFGLVVFEHALKNACGDIVEKRISDKAYVALGSEGLATLGNKIEGAAYESGRFYAKPSLLGIQSKFKLRT